MKKILLVAMSALFLIGNVNAQRKTAHSHTNVPAHRTCGTPELPVEFESWMEKKIKERELLPASQRTATVYNLPVVVHVVHNGTAVGAGLNISDAQVASQIEILNADFRRLNSDTSLIPSVFRPVAGDCEINFCLAQTDPNGNATNGIDRINRVTKGWSTPPYTQAYVDATIKPNSIWNPNQYLNIWVTNLNGGILGYATFPTGSTLTGLTSNFGTLTTDGVVILYNAFGDIGAVSAPYNKGRTATHEIGHWLGLRHIWGDASCGTDYVTDTPTQQTANFGCPAFPQVTCSNGPNGDMHMNYMDYTDDACMYMFTNGQKTRVQTVMSNSPFRVALATSTVCTATGVNENSELAKLSIYPNPTRGELNILIAEQKSRGDITFKVMNTVGSVVYSETMNSNSTGKYQLQLAALSQGFYFLEISTSEGRRIQKFQLSK